MRRLENRSKCRREGNFRDEFNVLVCESRGELFTLTQVGKLREKTDSWERRLIFFFLS